MWVIVAAMVVNLMFFGRADAALSVTPVDPDSPVTQVYQKMREARIAKDFKSVWEMTDSVTKKEKFNDNLEEFAAFAEAKRSAVEPGESETKGMIQITPNRAWLMASNPRVPDFQGLYLVKEGDWKVAFIDVYLAKVRKDLETLKDAIVRYQADNARLPAALSELAPKYISAVPVDPFNDAGAAYSYSPEPAPFRVYSYGPDSADDYAVSAYDPSKGTMSEGDIILEGPAQ